MMVYIFGAGFLFFSFSLSFFLQLFGGVFHLFQPLHLLTEIILAISRKVRYRCGFGLAFFVIKIKIMLDCLLSVLYMQPIVQFFFVADDLTPLGH